MKRTISPSGNSFLQTPHVSESGAISSGSAWRDSNNNTTATTKKKKKMKKTEKQPQKYKKKKRKKKKKKKTSKTMWNQPSVATPKT
jgi:hypothetical protein